MESNQTLSEEIILAVKDGPPSETIVRALAEVHDGDHTDMKPIYEVVDLEAIDALFRGPNPGSVTFEYGEYTVVVREDAEVAIEG